METSRESGDFISTVFTGKREDCAYIYRYICRYIDIDIDIR